MGDLKTVLHYGRPEGKVGSEMLVELINQLAMFHTRLRAKCSSALMGC